MTTFTDDFNRADSTDLGPNWVQVSGTWAIVSNQLSPGSTAATVVVRAAGAMSSSDHYAQITIAATTGVSQGVWCRGDSTLNNGYVWRHNGTSSWDLFSVVSGTFTNIGTFAASVSAGDIARVQAVGSTITGSVNGVTRVSVTNTAVTSGTSVGLRSMANSALRYDNFAAADMATSAALTPAGSTGTAQTLTGTKTLVFGTALEAAAAQTLTGAKAAPLGTAAATETAQPLAGTKTLLLTPATTVETAQALAAAKAIPLSPAAASETAQPLTGTKTLALTLAIEISTAVPLLPAGLDLDFDITVGAPYAAPYTAGPPQPSRWEVGTPC